MKYIRGLLNTSRICLGIIVVISLLTFIYIALSGHYDLLSFFIEGLSAGSKTVMPILLNVIAMALGLLLMTIFNNMRNR